MKATKKKPQQRQTWAVLRLADDGDVSRLRKALTAVKRAGLKLDWIVLCPPAFQAPLAEVLPELRGVTLKWLEAGPGSDWSAFVQAAAPLTQTRLLLLPRTWAPEPMLLQALFRHPEKDWLQGRRGPISGWANLAFGALGFAPMDFGAPSLVKNPLLGDLAVPWPSHQNLLGPRLLRLARLRRYSVQEVIHGQSVIDAFSALGVDKDQLYFNALRLSRKILIALAVAGVGAMIYRSHAALGLLLITGGLMTATYLFGKRE